MTNLKVTDKTPEQRHLDNLVNRCISFADRNGKANGLAEYPVTEYRGQDITVVFARIEPNKCAGRCWVKVWQQDKLVLDVEGDFIVEARNIKAVTYIPGDWEKKVAG